MNEEIRIIFDSDGDCVIDAHDKYGAHIKGSAEFTSKLADQLGTVKERHAGHDHQTTKVATKSNVKA